MFRALPALVALTVTVAAATGCSAGPELETPGKHAGCIGDFDPAADYFPDKSTVSEATNFAIEYHRSYQVLTVKQPYPGGAPASYLLVRCGVPTPALTGGLSRAQVVTVPVSSLYSASTTHLAMISELGADRSVTGVADRGHVTNPTIRDRLDAGRTVEYAPGNQVNIEAVLAARPDVLVTAGNDDLSYAKLRAGGVPVVADAEWLETTPLGRAEWIKVFAALTGTERTATQVYQAIRQSYHRLAEQVSGTAPVDVLAGTLHQGSWSMPTGADYGGRLLVDAGGSYPWAAHRDHTGLQLSFESVYARAGRARLWLVTAGWRTIDDALAQDNRYGALGAVRDGQVWSAGGTSDYWERGAARPDLVLADLIAILHPELAPDHRFEFYRQVAP